MDRLEGKVAVVTGAAYGNGRGIACNAIAPGYNDTGMTERITENPVFKAALELAKQAFGSE